MSIFGIDWLNKAKKNPQQWGWILNSQQYTADFFRSGNSISVSSAINASSDTPAVASSSDAPQVMGASSSVSNVDGNVTQADVSAPTQVDAPSVGDLPTEVQQAQTASTDAQQDQTASTDTPQAQTASTDAPQVPQSLLDAIKKGKQLKTGKPTPPTPPKSVLDAIKKQGGKLKKAAKLENVAKPKSLLDAIKQQGGKLKKKHTAKKSPTITQKKPSMEDLLQAKMQALGQFTSQATPSPSPTPWID